MNRMTTVQLSKTVLESLKESREYPKQPYNELISRLVESFKSTKTKNQYDEFLHKIQQQKMKELWDNKEDVVWDNV